MERDVRVIDLSNKYAKEFSGDETQETMFAKLLDERKAMVVKKKPKVFFEKIRKHFTDKGMVEGRDYFMGLVKYRAKGISFTYNDIPKELFHKDGEFAHQQEYRIALNPE